MKYSLNLEGFKPFEFLENHVIVSKIIELSYLDNKFEKAIKEFKEMFYYYHIKINIKNPDKLVFILKRREEKLCVGFHNNRIIVGFDCREYTEKDIEHDIFIADLEKKFPEFSETEA